MLLEKGMWDDPYKDFWTFDELAEALEKNPRTFKAHFKQEQTNLRKQGILITKYGRGDKARYTLEYKYDDEEY